MKQRHMMTVAAHLLLRNSDGKILFLRRANTGYADGYWTLPAGHVETGETIHAATVRETREEVGVELSPASISPVLVQHKRDTDGQERIDFFLAADLPPGQRAEIAEPDRCDQLAWHDVGQPPAPLVPYVAGALASLARRPTQFLAYFGFE